MLSRQQRFHHLTFLNLTELRQHLERIDKRLEELPGDHSLMSARRAILDTIQNKTDGV